MAIVTRIRKWNRRVRGKIYNQYVIVVPKEIAEALKLDRKYLITIEEAGE